MLRRLRFRLRLRLHLHSQERASQPSTANNPEPREKQLDDMMAELGGAGGGQPVEATEVVKCPVGDAERDDGT